MTLPRPYNRRRWIELALAAPVGGLTLPVFAAKPDSVIDWPALADIEGHNIAPDSWRGVPSVIVFWATWCAYCKRHNTHIDALFRSMDGSRLPVMGVVVDADAAAARQ